MRSLLRRDEQLKSSESDVALDSGYFYNDLGTQNIQYFPIYQFIDNLFKDTGATLRRCAIDPMSISFMVLFFSFPRNLLLLRKTNGTIDV